MADERGSPKYTDLRNALVRIAEHPDTPPAIRLIAREAVAPADKAGERWCWCGCRLEPQEAHCVDCRMIYDTMAGAP